MRMNPRHVGGPAPHFTLLLALLGLTPHFASAQKLDEGNPPRNVGLEVIEQPYTVQGGSVAEIDLALRLALGLKPTRFPYRYAWQFSTRTLSGDFGSSRSGLCRVNDVEIVFQVEARYPVWERAADATPELISLWERFDAEIVRHWEAVRDALFSYGEEVSDEFLRLTGACDSIRNSAQELMARLSYPDSGAVSAVSAVRSAEAEVLRWPPSGP